VLVVLVVAAVVARVRVRAAAWPEEPA